MRHTCGQRSSVSAGSKCRELAFYFCVQICHMFLISKCRKESDPGLYTTSGLANGVPPRIDKFRQVLRQYTFCYRKSPPRSGILFASTWAVRPRSDSFLHFDLLGTCSNFVHKNKMLALDVCILQTCSVSSSADRIFAASRTCSHYHRRIVLFPQKRIEWNANAL